MFSWLVNPFMLGLGALAVASPIIIHLLNRRRFKIVDWAAMDFLLNADKKNRRRVQVENLILLFLRCLAMFLIGLLLARPFLPSDVVQAIQSEQKCERIFLVDDSLSSQVLNGGVPAIDVAKASLAKLITEFAESDETEDWLTLALTSNANQPALANEPITKETLPTLLDSIEKITSTDARADYSSSLNQLRRAVSDGQQNVSRMVYVMSDLRQQDWLVSQKADQLQTPNQWLNQLALDATACYLVDVGDANDANIAITSLRPLDLQVANRVVRFAATVTNFGTNSISGLRIVFTVNGSTPQYQEVANLLPGQSQEVVFPYLVVAEQERFLANEKADQAEAKFENLEIVAEIDRQSLAANLLAADQLISDSTAYCAARIYDSIPVLLVDGDPSSVAERSETHYLNSLNVVGTGLSSETVTLTELETVSLSKYRVIFLCNIDEASADRIESLKSWVEDGGNLVIMPGNKVRAGTFNSCFYEDGAGLSPLQLQSISGDATMSTWVNFEVLQPIHPSLRVVVDSDQTSLSKVDVFSWWTSDYDAAELDKTFTIPLRLSDDQNSPAMAERSWGNGRVVTFTVPADGDWSMWPSSPTYPPVMIDLIDYLVGAIGESANVEVGGAIAYPVDLSRFSSRVRLKDPNGDHVESIARPIENADGEIQDEVLCRVRFDDIKRRGFYQLGLKTHQGSSDEVLFATNSDPQESQLKRLDEQTLSNGFFSDQITRLKPEDIKNEKVSGGNTEIWPQIVWLLLIVLAAEQYLGWWFGRRR